MKNQDLHNLFIDELQDMYSAENQIVESLPKLIKLASSDDLRESLTKHLKETKHQVTRIEEIFSLLKMAPTEKICAAMKGLLKEADDIVKGKTKSPSLDAGIICAAQKVEHYEIASYGTLRSFAKHLELDGSIISRLEDSLEEEGNANKALTKIADGSFFTTGVNQEAAKHHKATK